MITWETPSKKKNFEMTKVLTSMTVLPAMTARRVMMLKTRRTLRMTYPGPARGSRVLLERLKMPIIVVVMVEFVKKRKAWVLDAGGKWIMVLHSRQGKEMGILRTPWGK